MSSTISYQLVLYSKPGCHLCEGLLEKVAAIQQLDPCPLNFKLDIRDITTRTDWFETYQYDIPVLYWVLPSDALQSDPLVQTETRSPSEPTSEAQTIRLVSVPRPSPRASIKNVLKILQSSLP